MSENLNYTPVVLEVINDEDSIADVSGKFNNNLTKFGISDSSLVTDAQTVANSISAVGYSGRAADIATWDSTHRAASDYDIALWTANGLLSTKIDTVNATITQAEENMLNPFRGAAGMPYDIGQLVNDGDPDYPAKGPYLEARECFILNNVQVTRFEDNTDGEDAEIYAYTGVVELENYLYNGENSYTAKNNCIYPKELEEIEYYTAFVEFDQANADKFVSKITNTTYINGKARVEITMGEGAGPININTLLFIRKQRNLLPSNCVYADYLESKNASTNLGPCVSSGINVQNYDAEIIFTIPSEPAMQASYFLLGNQIGFGFTYNNSAWRWMVNINGTESVFQDAVPIRFASIYAVIIKVSSTQIDIYINGTEHLQKTGIASPAAQTVEFYTCMINNTYANCSLCKLYSAKLFNHDTGLLLGDFKPVVYTSGTPVYVQGALWDMVNNSVRINSTAIGTLEAGYDPDLRDYIITGNNSPTQFTRGVTGQFYRVKDTNQYYRCAGTSSTGIYVWEPSLIACTYDPY